MFDPRIFKTSAPAASPDPEKEYFRFEEEEEKVYLNMLDQAIYQNIIDQQIDLNMFYQAIYQNMIDQQNWSEHFLSNNPQANEQISRLQYGFKAGITW